MSIDAKLVMELRQRTGVAMMECKKFLSLPHVNGDIKLAIDEMRKAGQAKADKKADRIAAEGVVAVARSADGRAALMVEINSETDFVARDENFTHFAKTLAETALKEKITDIDILATTPMPGTEHTVEQKRQELIAKLGENIKIRRIALVEAEGAVGAYLHGSRIGVLVAINTQDETLAKDIAMHIAANRPLVIRCEDVPQSEIDHEREIFTAQASTSGKPADIIAKMVDGRISKYVDEVSLMGQPYVKDPNKKVAQLLKEKNTEVVSFVRLEVGEGIEKKEDNFVEEVMAQVRES